MSDPVIENVGKRTATAAGRVVAAVAGCWCLLGFAGELSAAEGTVAIGQRVQLLVDDHVIASRKGLTRRLGRVTKANGGKPIFREGIFYGTVLYDQGRFKLWWRKRGKAGYGYSESRDGIVFTKRGDVSGINFAGDYTLTVMIDPHETDPAHRYKASYDAPGMAAGLAHSADGIRFTTYNGGKPVTTRAADTYNFLLWDGDARTYRLFTRTDYAGAGGAGEWRGTRMMTNTDPKRHPTRWKTIRNWVFDREGKAEQKRRQIYAVTDWMRHGVHFAILSVYEWPGDFSEGGLDKHKRHERDVMNYYIATSRDADSWDLSWVYSNQPLVPRGPDGTFDKDLIIPASTIVTHAGRHWIYYGGANERHGGPGFVVQRDQAVGLATIGEDRLVGLDATSRGTLVTRPFRLDGRRLLVNTKVRKRGSVRVAVLDSNGKTLEKFSLDNSRTITGDQAAAKVDWAGKARLKSLVGQVIQLQFEVNRASVYSFQIAK